MVVGHFYPHVGGVEKLFMDLAHSLARRGHEVRVICCEEPGARGRREMDGYEIFYYPWPILFGHPLVRGRDLAEHIRWCDIVHTTTFTPAPPARRQARRQGRPIVITVHEALGERWGWIEENPLKAAAFRAFEKYVITRDYDFWIADSLATQADMEKLGITERVGCVYPMAAAQKAPPSLRKGGELEEYFGLPQKTRAFLYYGRPGQPKGIFVYLKAIRLLLERYGEAAFGDTRFCFILANDPKAQKDKFLSLVKEYGLEGKVIVRDPVERERLSAMIPQALAVVVPSITEGFGYSAVEACAQGAPLIHSDGGSLTEVVYGRCLPFRNRDSGDLCEKLWQVISGKAQFRQIPAKEFSPQAMVAAVENIYGKMLGGKGR